MSISRFIRECIIYYTNTHLGMLTKEKMPVLIDTYKQFVQIGSTFFVTYKTNSILSVYLPFIVEDWEAKIDSDLYGSYKIIRLKYGKPYK